MKTIVTKSLAIACILTLIFTVTPIHILDTRGYETVQAATQKISISKKSLSLSVGKSYTLKLNNANGAIKWSSSNAKVAKVSKNGKVTAVKKGKCSILANYKGKSYKCSVKVITAELITNQTVIAAKDAEVKSAVKKKSKAILNSGSSIVKSDKLVLGKTYTGTAYYISKSEGNDENDGLTPETAFKSLNRPNWGKGFLKKGDIVYLKRGDVWQGESIVTVEGVTYSAYGKGPKPIIESSPVDGCNPEDWELYSNVQGKKIWKYKDDVEEVAGIYFNDGESYATRAFGWWVNDHYENLTFTNTDYDTYSTDSWEVKLKGGKQTVKGCLKKDLMFCYMADYTGVDYPINIEDYKGPVYLRCDRGNPAEVYDSVKFVSGYNNPTDLCSNVCLDNISVRYFLQYGIGLDITKGYHDFVVQNCEVAYGGNHYYGYPSEKPSRYVSFGDAIYGLGQNAIIRNNYIHDVDCCGIAVEGEAFDKGDFEATGNLIERCGWGISLTTFKDNGNGINPNKIDAHFDKISIQDNILLGIGDGWVHAGQCTTQYLYLIIKDTDLTLKNNIFWGTHNRIAELYDKTFQKSVDADNNVFLIGKDRSSTFFVYDAAYDSLAANDKRLAEHAVLVLGDENVKIYVK